MFLCTQPSFVIREVLEPPGDVIEHGVVGVFVEVVNVEIRVPVHVIPAKLLVRLGLGVWGAEPRLGSEAT